jgi:hypothetical protein
MKKKRTTNLFGTCALRRSQFFAKYDGVCITATFNAMLAEALCD